MREFLSSDWIHTATAVYMMLLSAYAIYQYPEGKQRKILINFLCGGIIVMCGAQMIQSKMRDNARERFWQCVRHPDQPGCAAILPPEMQGG